MLIFCVCVCVYWSVRHVGKIENLLVTVWKTHDVNLINCFAADMWSCVFFMIILYVCTLHFTDSALWFQEAVAFGHKTEVRMAVSPLDMLFSHYFELASIPQSVFFVFFLVLQEETRVRWVCLGQFNAQVPLVYFAHKLACIHDLLVSLSK